MARLTKNIDENLQLIYTPSYPILHNNQNIGHRHALLGIGGNMGNVVRRFEHLYYFLVKSSLVTIVETSPILRNPPFGYLKQDDFFNAVVHIRTSLMPRELLEYMLRVEKYFGRKREFQDGPRTLDIDLIFYENREINTSRLTVPHPNWQDRDSVKIPLSKMKGKRWSKRLL